MKIFQKVRLIENSLRLGALVCKSLGKNAKNNGLKSSFKLIEKKALLNNLQPIFIMTFF